MVADCSQSSHHCHFSLPYDFHQQLPTFNTQIVCYTKPTPHHYLQVFFLRAFIASGTVLLLSLRSLNNFPDFEATGGHVWSMFESAQKCRWWEMGIALNWEPRLCLWNSPDTCLHWIGPLIALFGISTHQHFCTRVVWYKTSVTFQTNHWSLWCMTLELNEIEQYVLPTFFFWLLPDFATFF